MIDYEIEKVNSDYEKENAENYCTNPITYPEECNRCSWLDDYGWI